MIAGKNTPKLFFIILTMVTCLLSGIQQAKACHFAAADIYVTYIGKGVNPCDNTPDYTYEVTLTVYMACQTCFNEAGLSQTVQIHSAHLGEQKSKDSLLTLTVNDINKGKNPTPTNPDWADPDTVHSLCPSVFAQNSCRILANKDLYPAFRRRIYKGTVTLPSPQTDWKFSWFNGARNTTISNITACPGSDIFIEALVNNVLRYNNSTPRFLSNPLPYMCVNQPIVYLNSPYDINGDEMKVEQKVPQGNINAFTGGDCAFNGGYTINDPVISAASNPYHLNPVTGTATFTPTSQGYYVLSFRLSDYEKGTNKILSYVDRDVQVSVLPCSAPPPPVDQDPLNIVGIKLIDIKAGKAAFTCPDNNITFNITSNTTAGHNLYMYSNNLDILPTSNFTVDGTGSEKVTGTFSWTPTKTDVGDHTITITAIDSTCDANQPIVLRSYSSVLIRVIPGLDAGPDMPICQLNPTEKQLFVKGSDELDVIWRDVDGGPAYAMLSTEAVKPNPKANPDKTVTYTVEVPQLRDLQGCKTKDSVTLFVDESNTIDVFPQNPMIMCRPDYLQLDAIITGKGPISNMNCGIIKPSECAVPDKKKLYGSPSYGSIPYDTLGGTSPILPIATRTAKIQFMIRHDEMKEYGFRSASMKGLTFTVATPPKTGPALFYKYKNFQISLKCTDKESLSSRDGFEGTLVNVYRATTLTDLSFAGDYSFPFTQAYNWDTSKNLVVELQWSFNDTFNASCDPAKVFAPLVLQFGPTNYTSYLSSIPLYNDLNFTSPIPDTNATNNAGFFKEDGTTTIQAFSTRPVVTFDYCDAPYMPFTIAWNPGTFLSDSTILQPLAYVPKSIKYAIRTFGNSGCIITDSVDVYVPQHDFWVWPKDTAICHGEGAPLQAHNGAIYRWYEYINGQYQEPKTLSCTDCANPVAKPEYTKTYKIEIGDSVFCFDTLEMTVEVLPIPDVRVLTARDTIIKYGQSIQLQAAGARKYNWTPASSVNNPNTSYPIATPTEPTMYVVTGLGADGCRSMDTVRVSIDYRDNLFVPTAFSPNNDGKNDKFRIANLTFQRLMEFRVFNRWGQEVFSTTDTKGGWDGTWKGVPQEIGDYQYLIRVGYPDGYTESYKGDVTLVR